MTRRSAPISFLIPFALLVVSGCTAGTVVGGGASVGVAVAQERSVGDALDDTVIATQIVAIFFDYSMELLRKVSAEVVEGRVLLTGSVSEPEGRVDAVRLTWQIDGVTEVLNEIQVTDRGGLRSEEHTSELQSRRNLVCRLLLEKKNSFRRLYSRFPLRR